MSKQARYDDEVATEQAQRKVKLDRQQFEHDLRLALDNAPSRRVLWWVLERAGVFRSAFTGNSTTFYNEGKRDLGLELIQEIDKTDPEALPRMMLERGDEHGRD